MTKRMFNRFGALDKEVLDDIKNLRTYSVIEDLYKGLIDLGYDMHDVENWLISEVTATSSEYRIRHGMKLYKEEKQNNVKTI